MDQANDPRAAFIAAATAAAAAQYDAQNPTPASAEPAPDAAGADAAAAGPAVEQPASSTPAADLNAAAEPVPAPAEVSHPVFAVLTQLENEIVARSSEELQKLQAYVRSVRDYIADLF